MPTRRRRSVPQKPPSRLPWKAALIVLSLIAAGLGIGAGTAYVAQRAAVRPTSSPKVLVAMTPPPQGSYATIAPFTPIPAKERFSTAKPAQLTPAPTEPPTRAPAAARTPEPAAQAPTSAPIAPQQIPPGGEGAAPGAAAAGVPAADETPARNARSHAGGGSAPRTPASVALRPPAAPTASIVLTAEQFVREYLHALDNGDTATAYAYLGGRPGEPGIVAQEAPLAKNGNLHVLSLQATPDGSSSAVVRAVLESQGLRYRATYYIEPFLQGPHNLVIEHVDLEQQ